MPKTPSVRKRMPAAERRQQLQLVASEVFARRGYGSAAVGEIAERAGVTVPVLYDHFPSKQALYEAIFERHFADLREIWFRHATGGRPLGEWLPAAVDEWFSYVGDHPFVGRILFRDASGDDEIGSIHERVRAQSRDALLPLVATEAGADNVDGELAWETMRGVLQGLALWWYEHPDVTRDRIVEAAMNSMWIGLERYTKGTRWTWPRSKRRSPLA